ncbi:MAG: hypothetical protein V4482_01505 [Pseudomonadota bacterium]
MKEEKDVSLFEKIKFIFLYGRDFVSTLMYLNYNIFAGVMRIANSTYLDFISELSGRRAYYRASKRTPAYKDFLNASKEKSISETDKENYIKTYSIEQRCKRGKISAKNVMIDESSGSTGTPYNWVRSKAERRKSHGAIRYFARYCFGDTFDITINAFSMGAWATGMNMGKALEHSSIVKNTGPDIEKIFNTLDFFGPTYKYLILGYPPFIKQIIDIAKERNFPLHLYHLQTLVGGEGMSEGLRDYLSTRFRDVYSGYGVTDVEIGLAGETPLSVAIRRLARDNNDFRQHVFGSDSRLPMLFQYNPLEHHVEVNDDGELLFTINRGSVISPRIRYNAHDQGGIANYEKMKQYLTDVRIDIKMLTPKNTFQLKFPFMWVYGRKDFTISIMGANIYPEDIEQCVYADPFLREITRSFCQSTMETKESAIRPVFYFEINVTPTEELKLKFQTTITENLRRINLDYKAAWNEHKDVLLPEIHLYPIGEGPFKMENGQIKQRRMLKPGT